MFCSPTGRLKSFWTLLLWVMIFSNGVAAAAEPERIRDHVVIGGVKIPYGKTIEVIGPCLTVGNTAVCQYNTYAQATLHGQRIDGQANQEKREFHLVPQTEPQIKAISALNPGAFYKVRGQITYARALGLTQVCNFKVDHVESVPPVPLNPADFVGRRASFEGVLLKNGAIDVQGEAVFPVGLSPRPEIRAGKKVCVSGVVGRAQQGWQLTTATCRLVDLADLIGHDVSFVGSIHSEWGHWCFHYRGEKLFLITADGPELKFPDEMAYGRAAAVTGKLLCQMRPALNPAAAQGECGLTASYVIRGAQVTFRDDLASREDQFGPIFLVPDKNSEGVAELIAECDHLHPLNKTHSMALDYISRNEEAIRGMIQDPTPRVRNVLAHRMNDARLDATLRLLYATILARVNDTRGREYLLKALESPGALPREEVQKCLGIFPFLGGKENAKVVTDCAWAEQALIATLSSVETAGAAKLGKNPYSIACALMEIDSPTARKTVWELILSKVKPGNDTGALRFGESLVEALCESPARISANELLQLKAALKVGSQLRWIVFKALLRMKHPATAEGFQKEAFALLVLHDFHDLTPDEVRAALKPYFSKLPGEQKWYAQILLVLAKKDPVPSLIALLEDPKFPDKSLLLIELHQLDDFRLVAPLVRILRDAPKEYFAEQSPSRAAIGIENALAFLSRNRTRRAIRELIELMGVDLGRFDSEETTPALRCRVIAHLIAATGESFGDDQAAWRTWEKAQPESRFRAAHFERKKDDAQGNSARGDLDR